MQSQQSRAQGPARVRPESTRPEGARLGRARHAAAARALLAVPSTLSVFAFPLALVVALVVGGGGCKSEPVAVLLLRAPETKPSVQTNAWPAPGGDLLAPPPVEGVAGTLTVLQEVEQVGTGGIELHARTEITAQARLVAADGAILLHVDAAEVKMTPPVAGRQEAVAKALTGVECAARLDGGRVRFEPTDATSPATELARALPWLLPRALGATLPSRLSVPVPVPAGSVPLTVTVELTGRGEKDGQRAVRLSFAGEGTGDGTAMAPMGDVSATAAGWSQQIVDADGRLVAADGAITVRLEASASDPKADPALSVQQLVTTTATFTAGAP